MYSINDLKNLSLLKTSKLTGTRFTTKLEDEIKLCIHDKNTDIVYSITITKDKRTEDKYFIKSDNYDKRKFIANGEAQLIFFNPIIIMKIGGSAKSKENLYFAVDSNIDIYKEENE